MANWIAQNKENGKTSVLIAYSLGKAQRVLNGLKETVRQYFCAWRHLEYAGNTRKLPAGNFRRYNA